MKFRKVFLFIFFFTSASLNVALMQHDLVELEVELNQLAQHVGLIQNEQSDKGKESVNWKLEYLKKTVEEIL